MCIRDRLVERGRLDLAESRYETSEGTEVFALEEKMDGTLHVSREVADVKLWSAEEPYLYELRMEVYDAAGNLQEVVASKIGFRRFEMKDGLMLLNGKRIVFKGVNRHEFSSLTGRAVSIDVYKRQSVDRSIPFTNFICLFAGTGYIPCPLSFLFFYIPRKPNRSVRGFVTSM